MYICKNPQTAIRSYSGYLESLQLTPTVQLFVPVVSSLPESLDHQPLSDPERLWDQTNQISKKKNKVSYVFIIYMKTQHQLQANVMYSIEIIFANLLDYSLIHCTCLFSNTLDF